MPNERARKDAARSKGRERPIRPRMKVWVVVGGDVKFGDGRAELLDAIVELGSLQKAVARFGMSYRSVWGYFRELERALGVTLLERRPGGRPGGGTRLTPEGVAFLGRYRAFRRGLDAVIDRQFSRSFSAR